MICKCGGWQYYTVAELGGRERTVLKCIACKEIEEAGLHKELLKRVERLG